MAKPLVSVVIPAHNAEAFIGEALESVLAQSLSDLEVVVVDDGSSDETATVVSRTTDPRVHLFRQRQLGQSAAINLGVERTRGAFIKLLDADDWLNSTHLESQLAALESRSDCVASSRWGYFVKEPAHTDPYVEKTQRDYVDAFEWLVDSLTLDEGMMGGWLWLIPRRLWDRAGGYDPRLGLNNDFHFSIKLLLAAGGVRFAPSAIYAHRKPMSHSLSASSGRQAMESAFLTTELGTALLLKREDSPRIRKICADRFQQWIHRFYPDFPDLVDRAEKRVAELGGSELRIEGGTLFHLIEPAIGWKRTRLLQRWASKVGWRHVVRFKERRRASKFR